MKASNNELEKAADVKHAIAKNYSIGYLLLVTASLAVGIRLATGGFPVPVRLIGFATCCYWISKGIFAISAELPDGFRELVFLLGLPLYLCSVVGAVAGIFGIGFLVTLGAPW